MKIRLTINGEDRTCEAAPDEKLLDMLRRLGFKSVKFGCGEGTCGTCTVLIDGMPHLSCITFAAQMETLKRYRSKGKQTVRVERVSVESGGQAVVGAVNHGGSVRDER